MSPTALRTASTFECFDDEPFERDLPLDAPLLELRDLLLADFGFALDAFGFEALGFGVDLVRFDDEAARFFGLAFV
ncbi:MAG TPA: hypothetical protein VFN92_10585 [Solirubrobacterales bacterium]|nr:hypothetical protein [Solirubrobacterales bacterium]